MEPKQIITLYNSVLRGLINYYGFVHNYGSFSGYCYMILKFSCAKLLAAKFSVGTMKKIFSKYGTNLTFKENETNKKFSFFNPTRKINTNRFLLNANPNIQTLYSKSLSLARMENMVCSKCGKNYRVEMHHVRKMSNLNPKISKMDELMVRIRRKQIPLCRNCHMIIHHKSRR